MQNYNNIIGLSNLKRIAHLLSNKWEQNILTDKITLATNGWKNAHWNILLISRE